MLAEKFFLVLETLRSNAQEDGALRVVSTSPHIAVDLAEPGPTTTAGTNLAATPSRRPVLIKSEPKL
jgi:hypothetical protein